MLQRRKEITTILIATAVIATVANFRFQSSQTSFPKEISNPTSTSQPDAIGLEPYSHTLFGVVPNVYCANPQVTSTSGGLIGEIKGEIETSILFNFSPLVNEHVRKMFSPLVSSDWISDPKTADPMQVSCIPKQDRYICALRIWFRFDNLPKVASLALNKYQDNVFYVLELDKQFKYVANSGHLINIPSSVRDVHWTGPEDPRLIIINNSIFIDFINGYSQPNFGVSILRRQFLWSLEESMLYDIEITNGKLNLFEKNWSPLVIGNSLMFVYQLVPETRVLNCSLEKNLGRTIACRFVGDNVPEKNAPAQTDELFLRGGSPFVKYSENYYLAITHSVRMGDQSMLCYASQLTLIDIKNYRIVFVSSPILLNPTVMASVKAYENFGYPFLYARSIYVENNNTIVTAAGLNDNECFVIRIRGISAILHDAIARDKAVQMSEPPLDSPSSSCIPKRWISSAYVHWITRKNAEVFSAINGIISPTSVSKPLSLLSQKSDRRQLLQKMNAISSKLVDSIA